MALVPMPGSAVILRNIIVDAAAADDFAFDHGTSPKVPQPNHPIQQRRSYHDLATEFKRAANNNRRHSMYEYDAVVSATIHLSDFETSVNKKKSEEVGTKNPEVKVTPASVATAKDSDYDEVDFATEKKKSEMGTLAVAKPPPRSSSSSGSSRESDNIGRSIARKAFVGVNVAAISF